MTPELQKDAERLDRYITRTGLISVMNDTKWRETMETLQSVMNVTGIGIRFRAKEVRGPEPRAGYWDRDFPFHVPRPYRAIEWLEIDLVEESCPDVAQSLLPLLQARNIPFLEEQGILRIQGYHRPGKGAHP